MAAFGSGDGGWAPTRAGGKTPLPRAFQTAIEHMGKIFVWGGEDAPGKLSSHDLQVLNTAGLKAWNQPKTTGRPPTPRFGHAMVLLDGKVYLFGGKGSACFNDMYSLNCSTLAWAKPRVTGTAPLSRFHHSLACVGKNIIIFGGAYLTKAFNDVTLFDTVKNQFSSQKCAGTAPSPRYSHIAESFGDKMYVFGGTDGKKVFNDMYVLDTKTWEWSELATSNAVSPRHSATSAVHDNFMLVYGGETPSGLARDNLLAFDTQQNTWLVLSNDENKPLGRAGASLVLVAKKNLGFLLAGNGDHGEDTTNLLVLDLKNIRLSPVKTSASDFGGSEVVKKAAPTPSLPKEEPKVETPAKAEPVPAKVEVPAVSLPLVSEASFTVDEVASPRSSGAGEVKDERAADLARLQAALKEQKDKAARQRAEREKEKVQAAEKAAALEDDKHKKKIANLQAEVNALKSTTASQGEENQKLRSELEKMTEKLEKKISELQEEKAASAAAIAAAEASAQKAAKAEEKEEEKLDENSFKCKSCNTVNSYDDGVFCLECGTKGEEKKPSAQELFAEVAKLQQIVKDTKAELEEKSSELISEKEKSLKTISVLKGELEVAKSAATEASSSTSEELESIRSDLSAARDSEKGLKKQVEELSANLKEESESKEKAVEENEKLQAKLLAAIEKRKEISAQRDEILESVNALEIEKDKALREKADAEKQLELASTMANENASQSDQAQTEQLTQLADQVRSEMEEKAKLQEMLDVFKGKVNGLEADVKKVGEELTSAKEQVESLTSEKESLAADLKSAKEEITSVKARLADLLTENLDMKDKIAAFESSSSTLEDAEKEIKNLKQKLEALASDQESVDSYAQTAAAERQELETKVAKALERIDDLVEKNKDLQGKLKVAEDRAAKAAAGGSGGSGASSAELEEMKEKLAERNTEIERLEMEVEQWMAASEQLQKLGEDAVGEIQEEADKLREELLQWQEHYDAEVKRRREAEAELANSEQKLNDLDSMLQRLMG